MANLTMKDLVPMIETPENLVIVPTFITGTLKRAFLPQHQAVAGDNPNFQFYDTNQEHARGSNVFIVGGANQVLAPNFRVAVPTDKVYKEIYPMIKNRFYADLNALDIKKDKPIKKRNQGLWKQAIKLAEAQLKRTPEYPFRIQGFCCVPDKRRKGYQARLEQAPNFRVIEDDKLDLPSETRFNLLDKNGVVVPDNHGTFKVYTRPDGVLRVCVNSNGTLYAGDSLTDSDDGGRVVVVGAEGITQKFSPEDCITQIQTVAADKIRRAESIRNPALSELERL